MLGWISTAELDTSAALRDVQLAVEADLCGAELERLDCFLGRFVARQLTAGADAWEIVKACPHLFAMTMVGRAGRLADIHSFHTEYWAGLGIDGDFAAEYGLTELLEGRIGEVLQVAGLDPMDIAAEGPDGEFGRLLLHAAIPAAWVPAVVATIDELSASDDSTPNLGALSGSDVVNHYAEHSPTRQIGPLCTLLPDQATALCEAFLDFYRDAQARPTQWDTWINPDRALPQLIGEDLAAELRERPAGTPDREAAVGEAAWEALPRIVYDVERERVVVRLPQMALTESELELRWRVAVDGQVTEYRTGLDHDTVGLSETLDIPLREAAREVVVDEVTHHRSWTLPVLKDHDFLLFSLRGQNVTSMASLHHDELIVVCAADAIVRDFARDEDLVIDVPVELRDWPGFVAGLVDVSECASIAVLRPGDSIGAEQLRSLHSVDPRQRVRFIEGEAVAYTSTASGLPVHSTTLYAEFPATVSGATETWSMSIAAYEGPGQAGGEVLPAEQVEIPAAGGEIVLFDPELYESPWVGEYIVRLHGPRNESFRHRYAIVEGLSISAERAGCRIPAAGGLTPTSTKITISPKPCDVEPSRVRLGADQHVGTATVTTSDGDVLPLRISPPLMRFQCPLVGEEPRWRATPLRCEGVELDSTKHFRVRPGTPVSHMKLTVCNRHGAPLRSEKLTTWDEVTYRSPLERIAASLRLQSEGYIELEWIDETTGEKRAVRLVNIRPRPELDISLADGTLQVAGTDERLGVWVWPVTAPWRRAHTLSVESGSVMLPPELTDVGPLCVQVFNADTFYSLRAPARPGPQAVTIEQDGYCSGGEFGSLSAFLAGQTDEVEGGADTYALMWDLASGWLSHTQAMTDLPHSGELLRAALLKNPTLALQGLALSLVSGNRRAALFISSGLVRRSFPHADRDLSASPWLAALGLLSRLMSEPDTTDVDSAVSESDGDTDVAQNEEPTSDARPVTKVVAKAAMKKPAAPTRTSTMPDPAGFSDAFAADADEDEAAARHQWVTEQLSELVGDRTVEALETGRDQSLDNSCLDRTTVLIAQMDKAQQRVILQQFLDSAGIIPGRLSDDNSRLLAVLQTFDVHDELTELLGEEELMVTAAKLLRKIRQASRQLYAAARVRFDRLEGVDTQSDGHRWSLAPVVSLVYALAARIEAHGHGRLMKDLSAEALTGWTRIAELLPELVAGDIVAADAMVIGVLGAGSSTPVE